MMRRDIFEHLKITALEFSLPTLLWEEFGINIKNFVNNNRNWVQFKFRR